MWAGWARKCFPGRQSSPALLLLECGEDWPGKHPLPKHQVRAEGKETSVQRSHFIDGAGGGGAGTEDQRGAGPCLGSHGGFLFCLHSQHCQVRASPMPREPGWVGRRKVAQRRHRLPPPGQCRSHWAFRTAPESPRPPTLKVTSVTPDSAGDQLQAEG